MPEVAPVSTNAAQDAILKLVARRASEATVYPSEVARALTAGSDAAAWRDSMPAVHAAVDRLLAQGLVRLSWKGVPLAVRDGPYRIRSGSPD